MSSPLCQYFELLVSFVDESPSNAMNYFKRAGKDFTRCRLLPLSRLVFLALGLLKRSNSVELNEFFSRFSNVLFPATKSALTQARKKLLPKFFEDLFTCSVEAYDESFSTRRWKGFRLWATDGSGFRLPDAPQMGDKFGWHGNQYNRVASTRMSLVFDLLNQVVRRVRLHPREISEFFMAICHVEDTPSDVLMVYDRGYSSQIIAFLHQHFGSNCLVRMNVERSKTLQAFVSSRKRDEIITETLQPRALKSLKLLGIQLAVPLPALTYRLIRFDLPTGETEVLLTTLLDKKRYPYTHFGRLYRLRWGIESCFFALKSFFQLANFSAHLPELCHQDIYAVFTFYNIQTASFRPIEGAIKQINKQRKHEYKPNRNVSAGLMKQCFSTWFLCHKIKDIQASVQRYHRQILRCLEAIKPDENKERRRRLMRGTERHVHEKNYRRAL